MQIMITGGCGFVGVNLVRKLVGRPGVRVRVFDNESLGKRAHLEGVECEFVHGDIRDRAALDAALRGVDTVVHLAADTRVMDSIADPVFNFQVNVEGSLNLLEAMRAAKVGRLVNASTGGAIIGAAVGAVNEKMVASPMSPYGASKLAVEGYCSAYSESYGVRSVSLRFSNVFGPQSYHKGSVVAAFFKQILQGKPLIVYGDGSQVRDYVFVGDLCEGILRGIESDVTGPVQLGSGKGLTLNDLIAEMRAVVAPRTFEVDYRPFRAGEIHTTFCDISKARDVLGFDPRTSLRDGLRQTWEWFNRRG
ncbi:MAG TPA: SDR family NAD(P)-dependent oxidoreductase [Rhodoblastus sp.]|nr:SDR family NAD(P)-dependent oxidoreductase [Rhodoblastus sp.]